MTNVKNENELHNNVNLPQVHGEQRGKEATMIRRIWATITLLAAGWFLHDSIWHLMLAAFGMNTLMGMEFSLPDLGAYNIYPDRAVQTFAFLFAIVVASLLLWLGLRLNKRS